MSRTYRRKDTDKPWWFCRELVRFDDGTYEYVLLTGEEYKRALAEYHADNFWIYGRVGAYGKKAFVREMRFKNKEILDRSIRDCNDEPMFMPYKHPYK